MTIFDIHTTMRGFKKIAGLPKLVGTVDYTHIEWDRRHIEQHFEYCWYKGYTSLVMLLFVPRTDESHTYRLANLVY